MTLEFNIDGASSGDVTFGVGLRDSTLAIVPTETEVKQALMEMAQTTWAMMSKRLAPDQAGPVAYQPSETYTGVRYSVLPLEDVLAKTARHFHTAEGLHEEPRFLDRLPEIDFYFARIEGRGQRRLTAIRKAGGFKGTLKKKGLLQFIGDELKLVGEKTFQLDQDFDMLIDNSQLHILRPSQFETICQMDEAIRAAVPRNVGLIVQHLPFLHGESVEVYAGKHPRAARLVASIRQNAFAENIDQQMLVDACGLPTAPPASSSSATVAC